MNTICITYHHQLIYLYIQYKSQYNNIEAISDYCYQYNYNTTIIEHFIKIILPKNVF